MEDKYLSVSAINKYLKHRLDTDEHLRNVFLRGEISNLKPYSSGHLYFTLKDETSRISAVMFSTSTKRLSFKPEDGMKVLVTGRISVYEATGNYQVYIEDMEEDGVGNLHIAFEKLKEQLSKEGLFDPKHKKQLPKIPETIGIVTAPNGAAIKDILTTLKRRFPFAKTILFPSLVQGDSAAKDIVKQIKIADTYNLDLLIVGRGGGSLEDLWPFNEELVARAIFDAKVPIISAVGHEIDYTISDFVADYRAPTPTAAAEIAVPNYIDVLNRIEEKKYKSYQILLNLININKQKLKRYSEHYILKNPINIYQNKKIDIDTKIYRLNNNINHILINNINKFNKLKDHYILKNPLKLIESKLNIYNNKVEKLEILNPFNTLKRGYTVIKKNDHAISNIKLLNIDDNINIMFNNGIAKAIIKEVKEDL